MIMLTAYGNVTDSVRAIKSGAFDYLIKGDDNDQIIPLLDQAIEQQRSHKKSLKPEPPAKEIYTFESNPWKFDFYQGRHRLGQTGSTNRCDRFVAGETGSGKKCLPRRFIMEAGDQKNHLLR